MYSNHPPPAFAVQTRIKTLGTKHPLRRTHAGFLRAQALKQGGKKSEGLREREETPL